MQPHDAVAVFLEGTLASRWRDRFVGFVTSPKTESKLLDALPHDLMSRFDQRAIVTRLPEAAWRAPAYSFSAADGFGVQETSLRSAYQRCDAAVLVGTNDGRYAFHREEDRYDTELLLAVRGR